MIINILRKSFPSFKSKYLIFLTVYFAYNFANFYQIAETFWIKNVLDITAVETISISIWSIFPWSMKIIFGIFLDSTKICSSQRRAYIFIGAFLMLISNALTIIIANNYLPEFSTYKLLVIATFLLNCGFVLQDLVADTLCYESVDKFDNNNQARSDAEIKSEIANIQILVRMICIPLASFTAFYIGGIIATKYSYATISYFLPINTLISVMGAIIVTKEPKILSSKPDNKIILIAFGYILSLLIINLINTNYTQELALILGLFVVICSLYKLCNPLNDQNKSQILAILVVCFAMRSIPEYGVGVEWWKIDILQFDPKFFSHLKQITLIFGFFGIWVLGKKISTQKNIGIACLLINTLNVILQLPYIAMAFGLHEWTYTNFGFGAKSIALIDSTAIGFLSQIEFFLICTVATFIALKTHTAMWFALSMSLMSLAWVLKRITMRILAEIFVVEKGIYENIPAQMITTTSLCLLIPTVTILIFMNPFKTSSNGTAH